jgi:di/tricarboxylate transporter
MKTVTGSIRLRHVSERTADRFQMNVIVPAIVVFTVGLWATRWLPEYLTGLLFFALATIAQVAPVQTIFSGFASSAFWLVLSGFVLGAAIQKTGLADRVARLTATYLRGSYFRMVTGVVMLAYGLAFFMPSNMGRIALLMPIVMAMADQAGLRVGDPGRIGLALAVAFATFMLSASILPANVPNQVMAGAIEASYGIHLTYLAYLKLHAPVLGLLKGAALIASICELFPATPRWSAAAAAVAPLSNAERRLASLLGITLLLWFTDAIHGIATAWIGLASACVCLMPRIGFLTADEFAASTSIRTLIYIAAIIGLAALVAQSGLGDAVGRAFTEMAPLDPSAPFRSFATLVGMSTLFNFAVTANGVPLLYTPLAKTLADASGLPLAAVLMIQVIGFSTTILPYQASPIVVGMEMGKIPVGAAVRLSLLLALITFVILVPMEYVWFGWLGLL